METLGTAANALAGTVADSTLVCYDCNFTCYNLHNQLQSTYQQHIKISASLNL